MKHFVMNSIGYYLVIEDVEINKEDFVGCRFFDSLEELYKAAVEHHGLTDIDEVEGSEYVIKKIDGGLVTVDGRGCYDLMEYPTVAEEVINFIL